MLQHLLKIDNCYMPAFFHIRLDFPYPDSPLALFHLKPRERAVFIHEYIHYLQDVSSYYCLNNSYVYSEYIHGAVNEIYNQRNNEAILPINIKGNKFNINQNIKINTLCNGDYDEIGNLFILDIKEKKIKTRIQGKILKYIPMIYLRLPNDKKVCFGARAIMESMAYMIEKRIEPCGRPVCDYPYLSAQAVADFVYPGFSADDLRLIALCDMCLQLSNPGKIFYHTLKEYKEMKKMPTPKEIYDDFYNRKPIGTFNAESFVMGIITHGIMTCERLKLYLNDDKYFVGFKNLVNKLIGSALNHRLNDRYFMLELAQGGEFFHNNKLRKIMLELGSPLIIDSLWNVSLLPSYLFDNYHFVYFYAIEQIYNTIAHGYNYCELLEFCDISRQNRPSSCLHYTDDRCFEEPWDRATGPQLCPYAVLWKHWKLAGRNVIIK